MPRPVALITGASAGLGTSFAAAAARHGFDLVLVARRRDRLDRLAATLGTRHGVVVHAIPADLAAPDAVPALLARLRDAAPAPALLVNNAGFGLPGRFLDADWAAQRDVLRVLLEAPAELVHALVPAMVERGRGFVINVASVAGLLPGAGGHTLYPAAKAALIRFSEGLHAELATAGVHVTALCPGWTRTEFHDANGTRAAMAALPRFLWLDADRVAAAGLAAVRRNDPVCIPGLPYRAIATAARLVPPALLRAGLQRKSRALGRL